MVNGKTKRYTKLSRSCKLQYLLKTRCSLQDRYETALRSCRISMDHRLVDPCGLHGRRIRIKSTGMLINQDGYEAGKM